MFFQAGQGALGLGPQQCGEEVEDLTAASGLGQALREQGLGESACLKLTRVCFDSPGLFRSFPRRSLTALVPPIDLPRAIQVQERLALETDSAASGPRMAVRQYQPRSRFDEAGGIGAPSFAGSFRPPPAGMMNIELLAAVRQDFTGERPAVVLEAAFLEKQWVQSLNNAVSTEGVAFHTFEERCRASGMDFLVPRHDIDESFGGNGEARWKDEGPRKRLRTIRQQLDRPLADGVVWSAIRHPKLLLVEAGIRLRLQSFSKSWKQVAAGLRAWGECCNIVWPASPHLPACDTSLSTFAMVFQSAGTFGQYVSHVRASSFYGQILWYLRRSGVRS